MKKNYDLKKVKKQAVIGWMIAASGFAAQLTLETLLWHEDRPDMAKFIILIPFVLGGFIFAHAIFTIFTGKEQHPLHHKGEDWSQTYQSNMLKLRKQIKLFALILVTGISLFALFIITHEPMFSAGFIIIFLDIIWLSYCYQKLARCPACQYMPMEKSGSQYRVTLDLSQCPHCGATLSDK
ncbi:hypothetical protein [Endozoicomonas elysicola]|uniref:Uncharacterized protein n=1 Tax=Endozoicomonas elysicola TaxID=305900 RepID=A0A081K7C8_9GAMM|nr:hypothetical protein [Endozoicomonas elysicola]KEI70054.1 hypothetical protein GV64_04215 [Endozoicomonas elysicola]